MNRYYPHTIIAQEGWSFIIGGLVASILFSCLWGWWSLPFWAFTLFCVNFFRDPARNIPEAPDAIISPADGRVVVVERAIDPYRNTEALKISVFMNVFNVHSQRSPVSGVVTDVKYTAGKFLNASLDKSSTENERNAVLMTTRTGRELTFVQVAGLVARRVLCYVNKGDSMVRGERYGFIRFGSRVDVYLPLDATANVAIGDKVRASETILAYLPLEQSEIAPDLNLPVSSKVVAESRLKADVLPETPLSLDNPPQNAHHAAQIVQAPLSLDEARLAAETAKLKAEAEAAKHAAEQARVQAEAEIAQLKAQAEQARAEIEQAKAQAEAEMLRLKAEQEAAAKAQAEQLAKAQAEQLAQIQAQAEAARQQAEQEAKARAQAEAAAKAQAEQAAQLKAEAEAARLKAEQEAQARAQAEAAAKAQAQQAEAARIEAEKKAQAEAAAKARAEQEAQQKAAEAKARAEEVAKAQAAAKAKEEALAKAKAEAEAKQRAEAAAKAKAAQEAKAQAQAEQAAKAKAEQEALAEIAARKPIVRREVFAAVPEPWQTIEPREVIIRTEIVDKK